MAGAWRARAAARLERGREWADRQLAGAITSWELDGRLSAGEAAELRARLASPGVQAVVPHLGAHVAIAALLPFPLASVARAGWTAVLLLAASLRLLLRRVDRAAWLAAWRVHHPLVILLALVPVVGALAYGISAPVRANRLLLRVALDASLLTLPWRLHERTRARDLLAFGRPAGRFVAQPATAAGD
jgi:hypothetical protein